MQGYFVLLSWMPVYFKMVYNVNLKQAAWFSAIPWGVMALSGYVAGASADFMIKTGLSIGRVRKIMQSIGFIGPGVSLLCLRFAQTPSVAAVIMTAALGMNSCSQAGDFCNIQVTTVHLSSYDIISTQCLFFFRISSSTNNLNVFPLFSIRTLPLNTLDPYMVCSQAFLIASVDNKIHILLH
ncbi:unnamed protein product [Triticum turgidum subsp. durum]|uniref:Uncharacterized protein n=1 Tax=Triticum turgidum subsp. durum TaxID=4567 RepID=A0A9R0SP87_TRITD|nr:unnamed protein product [Triticum turgidum subsp. durum]